VGSGHHHADVIDHDDGTEPGFLPPPLPAAAASFDAAVVSYVLWVGVTVSLGGLVVGRIDGDRSAGRGGCPTVIAGNREEVPFAGIVNG
jgi:hypothetical protein